MRYQVLTKNILILQEFVAFHAIKSRRQPTIARAANQDAVSQNGQYNVAVLFRKRKSTLWRGRNVVTTSDTTALLPIYCCPSHMRTCLVKLANIAAPSLLNPSAATRFVHRLVVWPSRIRGS